MVAQNRLAEAATAYRETLSASDGAFVPSHANVLRPQIALAELLVRGGNHHEARELLMKAWTHRSASTPPQWWARGGFELAKLLWQSKPDRSQALEIAEQAKAGFEEAKLGEKVREVERWIAQRRQL